MDFIYCSLYIYLWHTKQDLGHFAADCVDKETNVYENTFLNHRKIIKHCQKHFLGFREVKQDRF